MALGLGELAQDGFELYPSDDALAELHLAVFQANFGGEEDAVVVLLAAHGALLTRRVFLEQQFGGNGLQDGFHFRDRHAGGVGGANQGAHTGSGDAVDRYAILLEHLDHTDMRRAPRAATGQYQADPRTLAAPR
ncbi:hypothetical protein D3C78_1462220 [compost metagenome]